MRIRKIWILLLALLALLAMTGCGHPAAKSGAEPEQPSGEGGQPATVIVEDVAPAPETPEPDAPTEAEAAPKRAPGPSSAPGVW